MRLEENFNVFLRIVFLKGEKRLFNSLGVLGKVVKKENTIFFLYFFQTALESGESFNGFKGFSLV